MNEFKLKDWIPPMPIIGGIVFILLIMSLIFKIIPDIQEGQAKQIDAEWNNKFNRCLEGCSFYEKAIPYVNGSREVYFDYCANDCYKWSLKT